MNEKLRSRNLSELANVLGVDAPATDAAFKRVVIDSRQVQHGDLFVAIVGPNFDGNDFVAQAMDQGAAGVLANHVPDGVQSAVVVDDTRLALGQMARAWRHHCQAKVAAITGSNGKTTVKEMLSQILAAAGATMATEGNLNNDYGVPLTLLRIEEGDEFAVIEMGANHPGEIDYLTRIACPDVAVITNAGAAHLEGFGSIEGVAHAKGEIYGGLLQDGIAVMNADDQYLSVWQQLNQQRQSLLFGFSEQADVRAVICEAGGTYTEFDLFYQGQQQRVRLPALGDHNVLNALAASAVALALNLELTVIADALERFNNVDGRLCIKDALAGSRLIDDAYNANPDSMKAAIAVLARYPGKRIFVMGDMAETGNDSKAMHEQIGMHAREYGIDGLYALGDQSRLAVSAFGERGRHFTDVLQLVDSLKHELAEDVTVLVKGSRSARMDRVVALLSEQKSAYAH